MSDCSTVSIGEKTKVEWLIWQSRSKNKRQMQEGHNYNLEKICM